MLRVRVKDKDVHGAYPGEIEDLDVSLFLFMSLACSVVVGTVVRTADPLRSKKFRNGRLGHRKSLPA